MAKSRRRAPPRRRYRCNVVHPITSKVIKLEERTRADLEHAKDRFHELRDALRFGKLSPEAFGAQLELLRSGKLREHSLPTVAEVWRAYVATVTHPSTKSKLGSAWKLLEPLIGSELVVALTDARLREFVAALEVQGYSSSYITKTCWAFLSAAVNHAKDARVIERLPWENFQPPRVVSVGQRPGATAIEHVAALALAAREEDEADRKRYEGATEKQRKAWRLSPLFDFEERVTVLTLGGFRNGEGAGLGWDHCDFDRELLTIAVQALDQWRKHWPEKTRPDFPTKNAKTEGGPLVQRMHPDLKIALLEQRAKLEALGWYRPDGPVFPTYDGGWRRNGNCIYPEDLRRIAIASGIPNAEAWVTHSTRHSFTTLELAGLGDPKKVIGRTGHASIRQLEPYVHAEKAIASGIPRLSGHLGKPKHEEPPP